MANSREKVSVKHNPQLKKRALAGGEKFALYLEYYYGRSQEPKIDENGQPMRYPSGTLMAGKPMYTIKHIRKKEELHLYLTGKLTDKGDVKGRSPEETERNKETLLLAEKIRQEREQERLNDVYGYRINSHKNDNLFSFFESYLCDYTKKDKRVVNQAINKFKSFLREYRPSCVTKKTVNEISAIDKEWADRHKGIQGRHELNTNEYFRFCLKPGQVNNEMMKRFAEYLENNSSGGGAASIFQRFKKVFRYAQVKGILKTNPCDGVSCERKDVLTKEILSSEEIARLVATHYPGENRNTRSAFILSLYTGLRFCDVKKIVYSDVDYGNALLTVKQSKTSIPVNIPLHSELLKIIGKPEDFGKTRDDKIFDLPTHTACLKSLRTWTSKAGIEKHISWHCARHSFATQILTNGANIATVANLLGHSGLKYVQVYVRALDDAKRKAINSLPPIVF